MLHRKPSLRDKLGLKPHPLKEKIKKPTLVQPNVEIKVEEIKKVKKLVK